MKKTQTAPFDAEPESLIHRPGGKADLAWSNAPSKQEWLDAKLDEQVRRGDQNAKVVLGWVKAKRARVAAGADPRQDWLDSFDA